MRILTVVVDLRKGGTQRAAQAFAEAYLSLGHDSRVLALYGLGPRYEEIDGLIPVFEGLDTNQEAIRSWNPELIHIHSHGPKKEDIDVLIDLLPASKKIETNVFSRPSPWAAKLDVSFQLSEWAHWLFDLRGGKELKCEIIPNPIKCDAFNRASQEEIQAFKKKHSIPEDAFVIGRIGQAINGKWSDLLIKVFDDLSDHIKNPYLLIVNPAPVVLEAAESSLNKSCIVHIPKIFGDADLSVAYSSMDVMLLIAEQGESFGMVIPECNLCETPVVTIHTPWGDNSQGIVVGNRKGGFVVNRKRNLAKVIRDMYNKKLVYDPKKGIEQAKQFDSIKLARKAIESLQTEQYVKKKRDKSLLRNILKDSQDRPHIFTLLLLRFNHNTFRLLTIYSSGYRNFKELLSAFGRILRKK